MFTECKVESEEETDFKPEDLSAKTRNVSVQTDHCDNGLPEAFFRGFSQEQVKILLELLTKFVSQKKNASSNKEESQILGPPEGTWLSLEPDSTGPTRTSSHVLQAPSLPNIPPSPPRPSEPRMPRPPPLKRILARTCPSLDPPFPMPDKNEEDSTSTAHMKNRKMQKRDHTLWTPDLLTDLSEDGVKNSDLINDLNSGQRHGMGYDQDTAQEQYPRNNIENYKENDQENGQDHVPLQSHFNHQERRLSRDQRVVRQMNIPLSISEIINTPMEEFNDLLTNSKFTEEQINLCRDIRRRGKNKIAAQNCRKRKVDQIRCLESDLKLARERKERLVRERVELLRLQQEWRSRLERMGTVLGLGVEEDF